MRRIPHGNLAGLACCVALVVLASSARAAVISYAGQLDGVGASAPITYGPDGYDLYSTTAVGTTNGDLDGPGTRLTKLPAYVSAISGFGGDINTAGYGYSSIDNPSGGQVEAGLLNGATSTSGTQLDILTITLSGSVPSSFYLGWISDIDINANDIPTQVRLRQSSGGAGDSGLNATTKNPDATIDEFFFKITGGQSGDVFTLSGTQTDINQSNPVYLVGVAGLTFTQTPTPEPASLSLVAVSGVLLARRRQH
jgi:hypothetical protein